MDEVRYYNTWLNEQIRHRASRYWFSRIESLLLDAMFEAGL